MDVSPAAPPDLPAPPIPLQRVDVGLLDAAPVLGLLRLEGPVDSGAVRRAFAARVPARLAAVVADGPRGPELRPDPAHVGFAVRDLPAGAIDRCLGVNVPLHELAALGLSDAPARNPLCTLVHLRCPDGDALAVRLSHGAGDGISLLALLGRLAKDLAAGAGGGAAEPTHPQAPAHPQAPTGPHHDAGSPAHRRPRPAAPEGAERSERLARSAFETSDPEPRWLSVLPLSAGCRAEIDALVAAGTGASPTVCRMAVVARRLAPLVLPAGEPLRVRIPIDLRFRRLGIPADAVGNHWFDALAVLDGPHERLPASDVLAVTLARTIRDRVAELSPADVDHRRDQSLRLTRDVPVEPLARGIDLVHSSLPTPSWPGVAGLHVLGTALLGVIDQRGTDRVDVVTPRPLPPGVREL